MLSDGLGTRPAEIGVAGLVAGFGEGRGSDAELSRASKDCISSEDGRRVSTADLNFDDGVELGD
jgi:hypothetical protein